MENISALRVRLYDCEERPADILRPHLPKEFKRRAWIPQTLGDQIWMMYEFETKEQREVWEKTLPESIAKWIDRDLIQQVLSYGWNVRDMNGFIVDTA